MDANKKMEGVKMDASKKQEVATNNATMQNNTPQTTCIASTVNTTANKIATPKNNNGAAVSINSTPNNQGQPMMLQQSIYPQQISHLQQNNKAKCEVKDFENLKLKLGQLTNLPGVKIDTPKAESKPRIEVTQSNVPTSQQQKIPSQQKPKQVTQVLRQESNDNANSAQEQDSGKKKELKAKEHKISLQGKPTEAYSQPDPQKVAQQTPHQKKTKHPKNELSFDSIDETKSVQDDQVSTHLQNLLDKLNDQLEYKQKEQIISEPFQKLNMTAKGSAFKSLSATDIEVNDATQSNKEASFGNLLAQEQQQNYLLNLLYQQQLQQQQLQNIQNLSQNQLTYQQLLNTFMESQNNPSLSTPLAPQPSLQQPLLQQLTLQQPVLQPTFQQPIIQSTLQQAALQQPILQPNLQNLKEIFRPLNTIINNEKLKYFSDSNPVQNESLFSNHVIVDSNHSLEQNDAANKVKVAGSSSESSTMSVGVSSVSVVDEAVQTASPRKNKHHADTKSLEQQLMEKLSNTRMTPHQLVGMSSSQNSLPIHAIRPKSSATNVNYAQQTFPPTSNAMILFTSGSRSASENTSLNVKNSPSIKNDTSGRKKRFVVSTVKNDPIKTALDEHSTSSGSQAAHPTKGEKMHETKATSDTSAASQTKK